MIEFLTCFKCWGGKAVLTYEENRVYKVSCECGCEYTFEHCSMKAAQEYHNKMLELYAEIDKNEKLKAENERLSQFVDAYRKTGFEACDFALMKAYKDDAEKAKSNLQEAIHALGKLCERNKNLKAENERLRVKCDSAVFDMKLMGNKCRVCKKYKISCKPRADELDGCASFEWRGIEETP